MTYAPVIQFDTARRRAMARQLLDMGVDRSRICATKTDAELADLWTRERTLASLKKLNGCERIFYERYATGELVELERATLRQLMGSDGRTPDQLIYSIGGRRPKHPTTRRRQHLAAWDIPA